MGGQCVEVLFGGSRILAPEQTIQLGPGDRVILADGRPVATGFGNEIWRPDSAKVRSSNLHPGQLRLDYNFRRGFDGI